MTKVTIDEITYSVTVAEENVNVTVADATETIQIEIATGNTQVLSSGGGNSLVVGSAGGVATLKSLSAGDNVTFSDDGNTITISSTEDDLSNNTTDDLAEGTTNLYYTDTRVNNVLASTSISTFTNDAGYITTYTETDPVFTASPSSGITTTNISNWDTAYGWGDHSVEGYLTSYTETDPIFTGHVASSITSTEITNWNTTYGWGDHSTEGYLTSYTETDPVFTASPANGITSTNISNWNTAYGWGDHSTEGYLTDLSGQTTDNLSEGSNNLYYTQARADYALQNYIGNITNMGNITGDVANFTTINGDLNAANVNSSGTNLTIDPNGFLFVDTDNMYVGSLTQAAHITGTTIGSVGTPVTITSGDILPAAHLTYDLGSPTRQWQSVYVGPGSLYIDGHKVLGSDAEGQIDITTDDDQNLNISAGGSGTDGHIIISSAGGRTILQDVTIDLGPENETGTINANGTLEAPDLHVGDLEIENGLINSTGIGTNLEIRTNGDGYIHANASELYVGPITGAVKIDESSISTTDATQLTIEGFTNSADMTTAITTAETNANDYTDTREIAITSAYQTYADQAEADAITTANSYADTAISNLVDSAPATLDTLNELAAALGDDANFSTTVTNSIATKWTQDNTKISNWDTAYGWGDHSVEGYLTDYTVTQADVTQHQAALSITESQISDLSHYTDSDARTAVSLNSSNLNELSYDNTTGVFSYTSPTAVTAVGEVVFDVRNTSGVAISRGDAVYISGHSGSKILVAKADANVASTMPAIGLANSAMSNNTDGTVLISGEMLSIDTSAFSVGDVLYVSETAGELTSTRPSDEATKVQNIGKVARSDNNNGIVIVSGSGRANDVPNLASGHVFIGNGGGADTRALTTADVSEGSNLYYTDGRVANWFGTTGIGMLSTDTVVEGSNLYHTDARAVSAVEAETTLNLQEGLTVDTDITIGDTQIRDTFAATGIKISNPATKAAWSTVVLEEYGGDYSDGDELPYNFHNPIISGEIHGGTPASPTAVGAYNRTVSLLGNARYGTGATDVDTIGQITISTTEDQTSTNRGGKIGFNVNPTGGGTDTKEILILNADQNNANFVFDPNADFTQTTISTQSTNGFLWDNSNTFENDVIMQSDLDVTGLIKVNDGFTLGSFDPFVGTGLPSTAMPTTIMGIGQEEGWAGLTIRSRGEHDWGLSGFGIPNEKPRALLNLSGGRLDGSSDDYLNDADNFGSILFNPYSGYKTGLEWLTPSAYVEAIATEDHSSSGMGTKLVLNTTENGNQAGATDSAHTNKSIEIQGTTISTSDTLKIDDDVIITGTTELQGNLSSNGSELTVVDNLKVKGSGSANTVIGDSQIAGLFDTHGFKINADETNWAGITLEEYVGAGDKPLVSGFANATVAAQVIGGTPSAKTNVIANKRLLTIQGLAANQSDGTLPQTANFRVKGETTEDQTTSNRGTKLTFESTANGSNSTTESLKIQGNEIVINTSGNGVLKSGGDLTIDDDVIVTGSTNLNGNVTLGDANTDVVTATGKLIASNGFNNTVLDTNTANYLSGVLQIVQTGDQIYCSDGNGGSPCMAFFDGSNWKKFHSPNDNISSS